MLKRILSAGAIALAASTANAAVTDGSFEGGTGGGWTFTSQNNFRADVFPASSVGFPTDGARFGRVYSTTISGFTSGTYGEISQSVDLTDIDKLTFDAALSQANAATWDGRFEASFLVDDVALWNANAYGSYLGVEIDVSGVSGFVEIAFRNTALDDFYDGTGASNWAMVDNVQAIAAETTPVPLPAGAPLLLLGLMGLAAARHRKTRAGA